MNLRASIGNMVEWEDETTGEKLFRKREPSDGILPGDKRSFEMIAGGEPPATSNVVQWIEELERIQAKVKISIEVVCVPREVPKQST